MNAAVVHIVNAASNYPEVNALKWRVKAFCLNEICALNRFGLAMNSEHTFHFVSYRPVLSSLAQ